MPRFLSLCLLLCLGVGAFAADLRVGLSPGYPPLAYLQDGRVVGMEADHILALEKILNREMRVVQMPFEKLIPALLADEIDVIMSGLSVTEERAAQVAFSEPYLEIGQMAIVHRDKIAHFAQPWSIYREGVRIGVEPGTTGAQFAERELESAEVKFFADSAAAFAALRRDDIDLYIHDAPTSWQLATSDDNSDLISLYQALTSEPLAWAVRKDDQRLLDSLNGALRTMRKSGTLQYIRNRWIPVTVEVR
tara:strand:+ start:22680 stop:23426 length:747 start_codon:yes stop_codon:yes gene_type:complete